MAKLEMRRVAGRPGFYAGCFLLAGLVSLVVFSGILDCPVDPRPFLEAQEGNRPSLSLLLNADECVSGSPLLTLLLGLGHTLWGESPQGFHALGLLLHAMASVLLVAVCRTVGLSLRLSLTSGVLFLVNVAHFQAVHTLMAFCYPLALIGGLSYMLAVWRFETTSRYAYMVVSGGAFFLASLAHAAVVFIPAFSVYLLWAKHRSLTGRGFAVHFLLPMALWLASCLSTGIHQVQVWAPNGFAGDAGITAFLAAVLEFWNRLVLTAHWLPVVPFFPSDPWEYVIGVPVLLALLWIAIDDSVPWARWGVWSVLGLLVSVQSSPIYLDGVMTGPSRFLYLASAGVSVVLAGALGCLGARLESRFGRGGTAVHWGAFGCLVISSFFALREAEAAHLHMIGEIHLKHGEREKSIACLEEALDQGPGIIPLKDTYSLLTYALIAEGQNARTVLKDGLDLFPADSRLNVYALMLDSMGADVEARRAAQRELGMFPGNVPRDIAQLIGYTYRHMGNALRQRNRLQAADRAFRQSARFLPDGSLSPNTRP